MRNIIITILILNSTILFSQTIDPCEHNTIQTQVKVDTFVMPDAIFLGVTTHEKETSHELDEIENKIIAKIKALEINTDIYFRYTDFGSRLHSKLFGKEIKQSRQYELRVSSADKAVEVISELNEINVGRIELVRFKFTKEEELMHNLSEKAIIKAKKQAESLTNPINQTVGRAIQIVDIDYNEINELANSFAGLNQDFNKIKEKSFSESPEFKRIKFVKSLYVVFELK